MTVVVKFSYEFELPRAHSTLSSARLRNFGGVCNIHERGIKASEFDFNELFQHNKTCAIPVEQLSKKNFWEKILNSSSLRLNFELKENIDNLVVTTITRLA